MPPDPIDGLRATHHSLRKSDGKRWCVCLVLHDFHTFSFSPNMYRQLVYMTWSFALLPCFFVFLFSLFVMDEFKRKYSNEDTLKVALPHFWEHFDHEGYSIWYGQYKYPEELTLTFKSCNLITGETRHMPLSQHLVCWNYYRIITLFLLGYFTFFS